MTDLGRALEECIVFCRAMAELAEACQKSETGTLPVGFVQMVLCNTGAALDAIEARAHD
jgi:hypothetical protein